MTRLHLLAAMTLLAAACNKSSGATANDNCAPGEVAVAGECRALCTVDGDCSSGEVCNSASLCEVGERTDGPVMTSIDGNGSPIAADEVARFDTHPDNPGTGDLTAHHLEDGLIVQGSFLQGAQFELVAGGGSEPLTVTVPGDTEVELALPATVVSGSYLLVASNAAGSDQGTVYLLRGEAGPAGSPDDGAAILVKLVSVDGSGSGLDADQLDGLDSTAFLLDSADVIDGSHISDGSVTAADIDTTGLDVDLLGGMSAAEITASALDNRCFEVRNDNRTGSTRTAKIFDVPYDCLSPYNGGRGCWGEMMTFRSNGATIYTSPLRVQFVNTTGSTWLVQANRGDATYGGRNITAAATSIANTTSDSGHCDFRTASGSKNTGDGFRNLNLSASGGSLCYLRLCETLLDSQQLP